VTGPCAVHSLSRVSDEPDREAAHRHLQAGADELVWTFAQTDTGRTRSEIEAGWPPLAPRELSEARVVGARQLRARADEIELASARAALAAGSTYAALGAKVGMTRQAAARRYGPAGQSTGTDSGSPPAA
jgi:hypothetical protein